MAPNAKGFQLTGKLSPDKGLQVQKDVLSYAHFQLIRGKISFKKTFRKKKISIQLTIKAQVEIRDTSGNMNTTQTLTYKSQHFFYSLLSAYPW